MQVLLKHSFNAYLIHLYTAQTYPGLGLKFLMTTSFMTGAVLHLDGGGRYV